jgi:hypothetical protein
MSLRGAAWAKSIWGDVAIACYTGRLCFRAIAALAMTCFLHPALISGNGSKTKNGDELTLIAVSLKSFL